MARRDQRKKVSFIVQKKRVKYTIKLEQLSTERSNVNS